MSAKKHSRRDLLKALGLGAVAASSPVEIFLDGLVDGLVQKAIANNSGVDSKYILIQSHGAPPRWMFDLFLQPYGGQVVPNSSVGSELVAETVAGESRYTKTKYQTYNVKGIRAPRIWTQNVGNSGGSSRALSDLMDNMLVLQGVDALNPGHRIAAGFLNRPLTNLSIDGALADHTNMPFGALGFNNQLTSFNSATGQAHRRFTNGEDVVTILPEAFEKGDIDIHKKYKNEIDRASEKLNRSLASLNLGGANLNNTFKSTQDLMKGEILKIRDEYPALLAKYQRIIQSTIELSKNLPGFSDRPVTRKGESTRLTSGGLTSFDDDLRSTLNGMRVLFMAEKFALLEYVITNGLTSTASLNADTVQFQIARSAGANPVFTTVTVDQHQIDDVASVFFSVMRFRLIGACTLGLIDALKAKSYKGSNMFNHTVIRQASEFGRHPRDRAQEEARPNITHTPGSDHAPWSATNMILSGMIKSPLVAGEIVADGATKGRRAGSWGHGGLLKHGAPMTTGHVISSIATMLRIPSPSVNNPSLVVRNRSGEIELHDFFIEKTKVVA